MRRKRLRAAVYTSGPREQVHDRTTRDIPLNAEVALRTVDDPLEPGAKLNVIASIKDDPLAGMLSRRQIEIWQYEAGRQWQRYYEQSEVGGVSAFDFTKEPVDGGQIYQAIDDRKVKALGELSRARIHLGNFDNSLITAVLGERKLLCHLAPGPQREREFLGLRFRKALIMLAELWGFVSQPGPNGVIR